MLTFLECAFQDTSMLPSTILVRMSGQHTRSIVKAGQARSFLRVPAEAVQIMSKSKSAPSMRR